MITTTPSPSDAPDDIGDYVLDEPDDNAPAAPYVECSEQDG